MKSKLFILITGLIILSLPLSAEKFSPWDAKVKIGDENAVITKIHSHNHLHFHRGMYNGMQGGSFYLIRFFQKAISPQDGPHCRFHPTCSGYGMKAVEMHGAFLGSMLAGDRLLRCNPYSTPGYDPVPKKISEAK